MSENSPVKKKSFTPDWLVQGVLTKIGDTFDRLTGRGWKPSSSLATSELIERMKGFLDSEAKTNGDGKIYVPHNIKLKMQWDKFSTDSEDSMRKLEHEFLIAAVDHINDRHYYTYAPLSIEVKPDYFTSGVKLFVSFEKFTDDEHEAEINVTVPGLGESTDDAADTVSAAPERRVTADFELNGKPLARVLGFAPGQRLSVGRTKENDLPLDDISVSKFHASLAFNDAGKLVVADTGSTNGTFVNGQRIAYGKAIEMRAGDKVRFGTVDVRLGVEPPIPKPETPPLEIPAKTETYSVGEFSFSKPQATVPALTVQAIPAEPETADETETEVPNTVERSTEKGTPKEPRN